MIQYNIDQQGVAVVTIDNPDAALNYLSFQAIDKLSGILDELAAKTDPRPVGVIFISGKADNFVVGVDIKDFLDFHTADDAARASARGQAVFGQIARLPFPSVAAINGACLGGGLELALNCTSRVITDHPKTVLGVPEVKIGLLPGASGSTLLPRRVGVQAALDMMLTGRNVYPYKARKIGLADEIVSPGVLLEAARKQVLRLAGGAALKRRKPPLVTRFLDGPLKAVVFRAARKQVLKQTRGNFPAPLKMLEVVRKGSGMSLQKALAREAQAFGQLAMTAEHQALTHLFFAGRARADIAVEPQPVRQVGVLGAGLMGAGIATVSLDRGLTVRHKDVSFEALGQGRGYIERYFNGRVKKHILTRRDAGLTMTHYSPTTDYSGFGAAQVVIEAVFEQLELKRRIIAELEEVVGPDTVIATNTSSLPIAEIVAGAKHPERIIGMHFFSPVEKMPLVEIITSDQTNQRATATITALARRLGKTPILVKDSPGFFINRILSPYFNEAFYLLEDGLPADTLDAYAKRMGLPVGPCTLLDEVGLDVAGMVAGVMIPFIGGRLTMTGHNKRLLDDKRLGRKNGRGFYTYPKGKKGPVDKTIYQLLDHPGRKALPYEQVRERLLASLLNEAAFCLGEGLIQKAEFGDVGAVYGFGFPPFLGGPFWAMDRIGLPALVAQLGELADTHGSRFTPAPDLVKRAEEGETYYG